MLLVHYPKATHTCAGWSSTRSPPKVTPQDKSLYRPTDWQMGRPADISARLRFMFGGCLKRVGTLSDGHGTAKEPAPLTEKGSVLLWATIVEEDRRRGLMCLCLYSIIVRLAGRGLTQEEAH